MYLGAIAPIPLYREKIYYGVQITLQGGVTVQEILDAQDVPPVIVHSDLSSVISPLQTGINKD